MMKMFSNYANKKNCPHIPRVHGNEISLMCETINDNENKNLFPGGQRLVKKKLTEPTRLMNPLVSDDNKIHHTDSF